jgi:penicillin-binding protein 1A
MAKSKFKLKFKPNDFWSVFTWTQIVLWSFILLIVLFFVGVNYGLLGPMPDLDVIQNPNNAVSTTIYSSDYEVLGNYYTENRIEVSFDELSPFLVNGLVATEDKRFYDHAGIDLKGLFRAVVLTGILHRGEGGGSTITQQLAKNLFHQDFAHTGRWRRIKQKIKEWVLSAKLERTFTKEEIIDLYYNTVEFGSLSYGIKTASFTYFYKDPKELKPEEAALLVAIINAPSRLNPRRFPDRAMVRRNLVLDRMCESNIFPKEKCDSLKKLAIKLNYHNPDFRAGLATYFREYLRQELQFWCDKHPKPDGSKWNIYQDGLKVYTTIDSRMQKYAEEAMAEHLTYLQDAYFKEWNHRDPWKFGSRAKPDLLDKTVKESDKYEELKQEGKSPEEIKKIFDTKVPMSIFSWHGDKASTIDTVMSPLDSLRYYLQIIQVGFIAADAKTGEIKAWIGGPNLRYFQLDHAKKTTKRQVGSAMKPFLYGMAYERNYTPCTMVAYLPPQCAGIDASWNPEGSGKFIDGQMVPVKDGLAFSDNRITSRIMCEIGQPQLMVDFARRCQIESPLDAVPSLSLGTCDISLYEMIGAYTCFANLGTYSKPFFIKEIKDKKGNIIAQFGETHKEAIPEKTAYVLTEMLKGVVDKGTAARIRPKYGLDMPLAGKTGTTQGNSDAWFMCYNPDLVVGAWVGFEQPSVHFVSNNLGAGANAAMPIVGGFLKRAFSNKVLQLKRDDFAHPADSSFSENFDCAPLPIDTTKQANADQGSSTPSWIASVKEVFKKPAHDTIANVPRKERGIRSKKQKHKKGSKEPDTVVIH